jgi:hypothetical protein
MADLIDCLSMVRHTLNQCVDELYINLHSLLLKCCSEFIKVFWNLGQLIYFDLQVFPNMLNRVDFWRLCRMRQNLQFVTGAEFFCNL